MPSPATWLQQARRDVQCSPKLTVRHGMGNCEGGGSYGAGTPFALRRPELTIEQLGYGVLHPAVMRGPAHEMRSPWTTNFP